jgi:hypothetical protein
MRSRPRLLILLLIVLVGCLCVGGFTAFFGATAGTALFFTNLVASVGDSFLGAVRDGNWQVGYALSDDALQKKLGSPGGLQSTIQANGYQPVSWNYSQRQVNSGQGRLAGSATYKNGKSGTLELNFVQESGEWKVDGFRFN